MNSPAQTLDSFGPRIMIIGPAGAGKSTLASALSRERDLPLVHLDLLFHQPHTDWVPRATAEFENLHAEAIAEPSWIIDGNYRTFMPPRLARATGLIWLDPPLHQNVWGYLKRCFGSKNVPGRLPGGSEHIKWLMVHHILIVQPRSHSHMRKIFDGFPSAKLRLRSAQERQALNEMILHA